MFGVSLHPSCTFYLATCLPCRDHHRVHEDGRQAEAHRDVQGGAQLSSCDNPSPPHLAQVRFVVILVYVCMVLKASSNMLLCITDAWHFQITISQVSYVVLFDCFLNMVLSARRSTMSPATSTRPWSGATSKCNDKTWRSSTGGRSTNT